MAEAKEHLRPGGRIVLNFGSSGDIDYLHSLIDRTGFKKEVALYGEVIKHGITARYYTLRLTT
jgi:release factor glutamine methyltransferase